MNLKKMIILFFTVYLHLGHSVLKSESFFTKYNLTWTTPSMSSFGSMPLGNGDIGINVWVEPNGDLLFYISKVNAYDARHLLPKLGRVRVSFTPALDVSHFRQTLMLEDGSIRISCGDANLRILVCANQPLISLQGESQRPRLMQVALEPLRGLNAVNTVEQLRGTVGMLLNPSKKQLAWCYRNVSSDWADHFKSQNTPEMVVQTQDPILYRTSGCLIEGHKLARDGNLTMVTTHKMKKFGCIVRVLSSQPANANAWLAEISAMDAKPDFDAHATYWHAFWSRSFIDVKSCGEETLHLDQCRYTQIPQGSLAYRGHDTINPDSNAFQLTQRYALERFCEAIASRGEVPPPYNGSIFTMDMPPKTKSAFGVTNKSVSPDGRDWAELSFMWQNTRHPFWSMAARGDYDCLLSGMEFIRRSLDVSKDRCKKVFGIEGAFIPEASWWYNVGVFNWNRVPQHLRYHQLATIELPAIMCDYYEHTQDTSFLDEILVPCATEAINYYANRFTKRDANGKMMMPDVGCVETYQPVTNPCTEMGALKFVLSKLKSFPLDSTCSQRERIWNQLLAAMPSVPTRQVKGQTLLAVGDQYVAGREICESPELYSVYPFRQSWLGTPQLLSVARQSFHVRTISLDGTNDGQAVETGGWQASPVQAACLGLAREAARLTSINFNDQFISWNDNIPSDVNWPNRPRARFPVFWECKMDGTPDNDHGANSVSALQNMLLQNDGDKIYLLPAWPEDWEVSFKLCANRNTTVECTYHDGKVVHLVVTPSSRLKDIVDMTTVQQRIRTLTDVALADYNYLFALPPMLDGIIKPGKTTKSWMDRYGYTLSGCQAGPWKQTVFHDNIAYVHLFDWPSEGVLLSKIDRKLREYQSITGDIQVKETPQGWLLTGTPDSCHSIVKLEFDAPLLPVAMQIPSAGSFCLSKRFVEKTDSMGFLQREVCFEHPVSVGRFEFSIDNPNHQRAQGCPYQFMVRDEKGVWQKVYEGNVFGLTCSMSVPEVISQAVMIRVKSNKITQFDVFKQ